MTMLLTILNLGLVAGWFDWMKPTAPDAPAAPAELAEKKEEQPPAMENTAAPKEEVEVVEQAPSTQDDKSDGPVEVDQILVIESSQSSEPEQPEELVEPEEKSEAEVSTDQEVTEQEITPTTDEPVIAVPPPQKQRKTKRLFQGLPINHNPGGLNAYRVIYRSERGFSHFKGILQPPTDPESEEDETVCFVHGFDDELSCFSASQLTDFQLETAPIVHELSDPVRLRKLCTRNAGKWVKISYKHSMHSKLVQISANEAGRTNGQDCSMLEYLPFSSESAPHFETAEQLSNLRDIAQALTKSESYMVQLNKVFALLNHGSWEEKEEKTTIWEFLRKHWSSCRSNRFFDFGESSRDIIVPLEALLDTTEDTEHVDAFKQAWAAASALSVEVQEDEHAKKVDAKQC
jgi:hypothetical protein